MVNNPIIGITSGDINGVGMEVVIRTFEDPAMLDICTPVIFASSKLFSYYKKVLGSEIPFIGIESLDQIVHGKINVLNLWKEAVNIEPGRETPEGGQYAFKSLQGAVKALSQGKITALVTSPINKNNIQSEEFQFPGHTEYLARELGGEALMFLVSSDLRVAVATGHIALEKVADAITPQLIEKRVLQMEKSLREDFAISTPKIAVLGIDPHVGDKGVIGTKDSQVIAPTVKKLFDSGKIVMGPYSSDGFFGSGQYRKFDAVLAIYHDQGLIPFKTIAFEDGVNYTACLSKVRTSPDHGTAYELAGKGLADPSSMRHAVYDAVDIVKNRAAYRELTADVLKKYNKTSNLNPEEDINAESLPEE